MVLDHQLPKFSSVLNNLDRLKYERRKTLVAANRMKDQRFEEFLDGLRAKYPDWTIEVHWNQRIHMIMFQSEWQRKMSIKDQIKHEALNGIVSDACHDYWSNGKDLLFISSTYEPKFMKCWVPILMTYSNGATAEHYRIHFLKLMRGILRSAIQSNRPFTDSMVANVVDHCEAQSKGFKEAFMDLRTLHAADGRTPAQLLQAATSLLKGWVVAPDRKSEFKKLTYSLLKADTMDSLNITVAELKRDFPHAKAWVEWWMRPAHAVMLFECARSMHPELWKSLPETTNAEEAMHHRIYRMVGRHLSLNKGIPGLIAIVKTFERQYKAGLAGYRLRYGKERIWVSKKLRFGRSKGPLKPRGQKAPKKSDANPPNKCAARVCEKPPPLPSSAPKSIPSRELYQRGAMWSSNSCWLDTSLQLLSTALSYHATHMTVLFADLPQDSVLGRLHKLLQFYVSENTTAIEFDANDCRNITRERNNFRTELINQKLAVGVGKRDALFGWLNEALMRLHSETLRGRKTHKSADYEALSYYCAYASVFRHCLGSDLWPEEHFEITHPRWRHNFVVNSGYHAALKGDIQLWFECQINTNYTESVACWRQRDSDRFCDSSTAFLHDYILSLPMVLIIEFNHEAGKSWKIPPELFPLEAKKFKAPMVGVRYDIIGLAFSDGDHFICRYRTPNGLIFDYDGMKLSGHAVHRPKAKTISGWLTGDTQSLKETPEGYYLVGLVYVLVGAEQAQRTFENERRRQAPHGITFNTAESPHPRFPWAANHPTWSLVDEDLREQWTTTAHRRDTAEYQQGVSRRSGGREHNQKVLKISLNLPTPMIWRQTSLFEQRASHSRELSDLTPSNSSHDESVTKLLLDTLDTPPAAEGLDPNVSTETGPETPCPLNCYGCGTMTDGDSEPAVQCEDCGFWTHEACLSQYLGFDAYTDWGDPDVSFKCRKCAPRPEKLFYPREVVMLPDPRIPVLEWNSETTTWYPARVMLANASRRKFSFHWLQCIQWPLDMDSSPLPAYYSEAQCTLMMNARARLEPRQLCVIRIPQFYPQSSAAPHLQVVFSAAITPITAILATYDTSEHPVILSYRDWNGTVARWLRHANLVADGYDNLDPLLEEPLNALEQALSEDQPDLEVGEVLVRVHSIGNALLRTLVVQYELNEPYNLNGDTFLDIQQPAYGLPPVLFEPPDYAEAAMAMLRSLTPHELSHKSLRTHFVGPNGYQPRIYTRRLQSDSYPAPPIPLTVNITREVPVSAEQNIEQSPEVAAERPDSELHASSLKRVRTPSPVSEDLEAPEELYGWAAYLALGGSVVEHSRPEAAVDEILEAAVDDTRAAACHAWAAVPEGRRHWGGSQAAWAAIYPIPEQRTLRILARREAAKLQAQYGRYAPFNGPPPPPGIMYPAPYPTPGGPSPPPVEEAPVPLAAVTSPSSIPIPTSPISEPINALEK
ncbi:hypothetical protein MIND_00047900 [Mycena indigotica]|uniref:PHD-type domain-containing protein n=1 Tax=Mycena indigotica TaxID=2126181 RepID=A0A8H6WHQ4_9AGAR|nr:uncharacterized protein MIND_00047900 [Mycena indigotica]KAF7315333.1 hypothetical protein MIND_00047900 [Mycena indigotica]